LAEELAFGCRQRIEDVVSLFGGIGLEFALIHELVKTKEFEWGKGEDLDVHDELFLIFGFLVPGENALSIFDRVSPREGFVFELLSIHGSELIGAIWQA